MKKLITIKFLLLLYFPLFAQSGEIKGGIKDATTGEPLIGASVSIGGGRGAIADLDGNYSIKLEEGEYTATVSYVGYITQALKVKIKGRPVTVNFVLEVKTLNEVEIVADVARTRETPIAFSNIHSAQIQEELGSRDIPMILNYTPGVYATEQGGGSGDSRINIRGFDQRNIGVLVDGLPVNDMENGQVYWSNWDGLSEITRTIQVQRGLGASKLAIPSVGGTMNIITKGIDSKMSGSLKQELGNDNMLRTALGFNSGLLKHGFGFTLGFSRKTTDGWVDETGAQSWSYYIKIQKKLGNHLVSIGANGAPQSHSQRAFLQPIAIYDRNFATKLGINADSLYKKKANSSFGLPIQPRGMRYNQNWGQYVDTNRQKIIEDEKVNFFHKPLFNLSDYWSISKKLYLSTIAYLSIGNGGGTGFSRGNTSFYTADGQDNFQYYYDGNTSKSAIKNNYDSVLHQSSTYLLASVNNHVWYGLLSTLNFSVNEHFSLTGGIDGRDYKGTHYQEVYNLLGGDYTTNFGDLNQPKGIADAKYAIKKAGDRINYYYDGLVRWAGLFAQAEYKTSRWSAFITGSGSQTGYDRIDFYQKKDIVIDNKLFPRIVGYGDTLFFNGKDTVTSFANSQISYSGDTTFIKTGKDTRSITNAKPYNNNSQQARNSITGWKWFPGYTVKAGANYNLSRFNNIFFNIGYMSMAPRLSYVYDGSNKLLLNIKNQYVKSVELGYGFKVRQVNVSLNAYITEWDNKPPDQIHSVNSDRYGPLSYNINGLNALHKGIEGEAYYKILSCLEVEGLASVGDWKYISKADYNLVDEGGTVVGSGSFSAVGVHVGNSAQIQYGGGLRYDFLKSFYLKFRYTYYGKNYAGFEPTLLNGINANRDSWKMPDYQLLDLFGGYEVKGFKNIRYTATIGVYNVLNTIYLSDVVNGSKFDANTATAFFGQGRRYNVGLRVSF